MAFGAEDLIGAWSLQSSTNFRDGVGSPTFGEPPAGQIQYTADGRMGRVSDGPGLGCERRG